MPPPGSSRRRRAEESTLPATRSRVAAPTAPRRRSQRRERSRSRRRDREPERPPRGGRGKSREKSKEKSKEKSRERRDRRDTDKEGKDRDRRNRGDTDKEKKGSSRQGATPQEAAVSSTAGSARNDSDVQSERPKSPNRSLSARMDAIRDSIVGFGSLNLPEDDGLSLGADFSANEGDSQHGDSPCADSPEDAQKVQEQVSKTLPAEAPLELTLSASASAVGRVDEQSNSATNQILCSLHGCYRTRRNLERVEGEVDKWICNADGPCLLKGQAKLDVAAPKLVERASAKGANARGRGSSSGVRSVASRRTSTSERASERVGSRGQTSEKRIALADQRKRQSGSPSEHRLRRSLTEGSCILSSRRHHEASSREPPPQTAYSSRSGGVVQQRTSTGTDARGSSASLHPPGPHAQQSMDLVVCTVHAKKRHPNRMARKANGDWVCTGEDPCKFSAGQSESVVAPAANHAPDGRSRDKPGAAASVSLRQPASGVERGSSSSRRALPAQSSVFALAAKARLRSFRLRLRSPEDSNRDAFGDSVRALQDCRALELVTGSLRLTAAAGRPGAAAVGASSGADHARLSPSRSSRLPKSGNPSSAPSWSLTRRELPEGGSSSQAARVRQPARLLHASGSARRPVGAPPEPSGRGEVRARSRSPHGRSGHSSFAPASSAHSSSGVNLMRTCALHDRPRYEERMERRGADWVCKPSDRCRADEAPRSAPVQEAEPLRCAIHGRLRTAQNLERKRDGWVCKPDCQCR
ncbi:unnamed protein product [Polarella glacialis]|uniref:Uncharacterized protein n=1 Tax=Polarella glacialis TaxID=89957 RepID=A0A813IXI3_POLGL|nr:unnamed protein product [Polarella glacialis]